MIRCLALGIALLTSSAVFAGGGGTLPFSKDVAKALKDAELQGKACMIYFTKDH